MMNRLLIATLALSCFAISHGFAPAFHPQNLTFKNACQELKSTSVLSSEYQDEVTMMNKARECAFSDASSADEARSFLHQILHVQSGCVSGVVSGHDLCENQDDVAEIVAHLRQKAESSAAALSPVASLGAVAALPVGAAALLCSMVVASTIDFGQGNPFTAQEWMWALKGGYLDDMMSHYLQNGGALRQQIETSNVNYMQNIMYASSKVLMQEGIRLTRVRRKVPPTPHMTVISHNIKVIHQK